MANIGFRVFKQVKRPSRNLIEPFRALPVATVADVMYRFNCLAANLQRINSGKKSVLLGPAVTVRTRSGDNLLIHQALDLAQPGDVIVIDGNGDLVNALVGENLALWAMQRQIAGIVIDGAVRDIDVLREIDLPIYAAGVTPGGVYKYGAGEVNVPICCGRVVVNPGDIVIGDADGVVVVPAGHAQEILEKARARQAQELAIREQIGSGVWTRPAVTDDAINALGCEIINDSFC